MMVCRCDVQVRKGLFFLGVLLVLLVGCTLALPQISSATVEQYDGGHPLSVKELSSEQVGALSVWFSKHGSGWSSSVVSYVPVILVHAKHLDGEMSVINLRSNMLVVYNRNGQYQRLLKPNESAEIRQLLEL